MRYTVTSLGAAGKTTTKIVAAIVSYLRPRQPKSATRPAEHLARFPSDGPAAYYADGGDEPGRWLGQGAASIGLGGLVDEDDFRSVLSGRHPRTGARLITAQGSAGRRQQLGSGTPTRLSPTGEVLYGPADAAAVLGVTLAETKRMLAVGEQVEEAERHGARGIASQPPGSYLRATRLDGTHWVTEAELERCAEERQAGSTPDQAAATGDPDDELALAEAARIAGVTRQYLRRLAKRYESDPESFDEPVVEGLRSRHAYLVAHRGPRREWIVRRGDLVEFLRRRKPPAVRVGYDLTLTTEKSLGVLGLLSDTATRRAVLHAIKAGNTWALRWLETHSAAARHNDEVVPVKGWTVASFRHLTSRALDPFPHHHNVVANTVEDHSGVRRALDARGLYLDAKAASALATAEMRHRLTVALGVRWRPADHGGWEIAAIPETVLRAFSQRRTDIEDAVRELEDRIGRGASLDEVDDIVRATRPAKTHEDTAVLFAEWWHRAEALGFGRDDLARCVGRQSLPTEPPSEVLFSRLAAPDGLCRNLSIFDRGDVLHAFMNLAIDIDGGAEPQPLLVSAERLEELADAFLACPLVEQLTAGSDVSRPRYTTREVLAVQNRIVGRYRTGLRQGAALVPPPTVDEILDRHRHLTDEQDSLVRAFCTSGHQVQTAVGQPGAGKTTSMLAAREAWEAAGFRVVGAAVKGEAARNLAVTTGIPTETLAWHLAHEDPRMSTLDARTVFVVDEASTISDRDLDRLTWLARQTGAALRLIGDPAQHGAVEAGGMFRVVCERHPKQTPELTRTHRLQDPHDRAAAEALRVGDVDQALSHLAAAGHLHVIDDEVDVYVQVLAAWWRAHQAGLDHPMVDRRNSVRRVLNRLAHTLRLANGELGVEHLISEGREFTTGDRVIARRPDRNLHPTDEPGAYVRNGATGTVVALRPGQEPAETALVVDFDHLGTIELPRSFVDRHEVERGRKDVGLDHAYAVTSYAVTGATLPVSTSRIDGTSSRAEAYVDITRGERANHLYLTRAKDPLDGEHLPRVPPDPIAAEIAHRLERSIGEKTAWEIRQDQLARVAGPSQTGLGLG